MTDTTHDTPLSEEQLAAIRDHADEYARKVWKRVDVAFGFGVHELLAELDRQRRVLDAARNLWLADRDRWREREAALLAVVRAVATAYQPTKYSYGSVSHRTVEQARALLASVSEAAAADGASEQG